MDLGSCSALNLLQNLPFKAQYRPTGWSLFCEDIKSGHASGALRLTPLVI